MKTIREALAQMNLHISNVETSLKTLNARVSESHARQERTLESMQAHDALEKRVKALESKMAG